MPESQIWPSRTHSLCIPQTRAQEDLVYAGLSENPEAVEYASSDGRNVYGLYTFYPRLNIGFVVEYPININLSRQNQGNVQTILIIAGFSLVIGLFLFFGAQRITKPLSELSKTVLRFSEGNWETRAQVNREDEIGLLAQTFNNFADELNQTQRSIESQESMVDQQVLTASDVTTLATNSASLDDLLNKTALLINERFDFFHTSIYIIDPSKEFAKLRAATGTVGQNFNFARLSNVHFPRDAKPLGYPEQSAQSR